MKNLSRGRIVSSNKMEAELLQMFEAPLLPSNEVESAA